jgi:hypothetical protein
MSEAVSLALRQQLAFWLDDQENHGGDADAHMQHRQGCRALQERLHSAK